LRVRFARPKGTTTRRVASQQEEPQQPAKMGGTTRKHNNKTRNTTTKGEKFMSSRIVLAASTLALGTALTAIPALAQDYGSGANNTQQYKYPIGRPMNDGGVAPQSSQNNGPQSSAAQQTRSARIRTNGAVNQSPSNAATAQNYHYPMGRSMDDGGFPQEQAQYNGAQRQERTGSAENMEHAQTRSAALAGSGPANYAYDPYGRGSYYDYSLVSGPAYAGAPMPGAIAACQARFHSYDPATGTYLGFDGIRHSCP
jgi:hypothetical protein